MRNYLIAFFTPFFGTLASALGVNKPASANDWVINLVVATAAGFSGLAGISINTKMDSTIGK